MPRVCRGTTEKVDGEGVMDGFGWIAYPVRTHVHLESILPVDPPDVIGFNYLAFDIIGELTTFVPYNHY